MFYIYFMHIFKTFKYFNHSLALALVLYILEPSLHSSWHNTPLYVIRLISKKKAGFWHTCIARRLYIFSHVLFINSHLQRRIVTIWLCSFATASWCSFSERSTSRARTTFLGPRSGGGNCHRYILWYMPMSHVIWNHLRNSESVTFHGNGAFKVNFISNFHD